jgi:pimeloyl-ACP methyl ester carboxylesterase
MDIELDLIDGANDPTAAIAGRIVRVRNNDLHVVERGEGPPLLLIHGAGEDSSMLGPQAEALAAAGYRVITYDRRGTGHSGREGWPGRGANQHADDAGALLGKLDATPAVVLGVSSGGVIALALADRHPEVANRIVAWEPPAMGVLPEGRAIGAAMMAPIEAHLAAHPGDFVGAQAILLSAIVGFPVSVDDPAFAAARANAEPMILDDPRITLRRFEPDDLTDADVTIAVGTGAIGPIADATAVLEGWLGRPAVVIDADHEVYLSDPAVLAGVVGPA